MFTKFLDILMWTIVGAMVFVAITNASGVASIISSFGSFWTTETSILATGAAPRTGKSGK